MVSKSTPLSSLAYVSLLTFALQSTGCLALAVGAAGGAAGGAASSVEQSDDPGDPSHSAMAYVGSVGASALYFPAKVLFAAAGAVTSGVAYLVTLGDASPSQSIWTASVDGDYVVTPRMIEGHDDVDFVGG